ncbi:MAG: hypothetical protein EB127_23025 [Alphaproteobacteria bacterium]|jgi:hypothetical protein|nr:hypothetical protein [Alphaproteobacteria bacterium]
MARNVYSPNEMGIIVNNTPIQGFAEDTMLSIQTEDAKYSIYSDIHGKVTRFRQNKNIAKIIFTLTQSSLSNDLFSSFLEADIRSDAGIFSFMAKDNSGTTLVTSVEACVEKYANADFANENKNREWTVICFNPNIFIGGIK